jgi:hypothetical protein
LDDLYLVVPAAPPNPVAVLLADRPAPSSSSADAWFGGHTTGLVKS